MGHKHVIKKIKQLSDYKNKCFNIRGYFFHKKGVYI